MKVLLIILAAAAAFGLAACDTQSGITRKSMEKYGPTPTPSPRPTEEPIDPADIIQVDTNLPGGILSVNESSGKKDLACTKYDQVMVNGNDAVITVKGPCRQIMVNGDRNDVTAEAASEIAFNGSGNTVKYYRFVNGRRPLVSDTQKANTTEKIAAPVEKPAKK